MLGDEGDRQVPLNAQWTCAEAWGHNPLERLLHMPEMMVGLRCVTPSSHFFIFIVVLLYDV